MKTNYPPTKWFTILYSLGISALIGWASFFVANSAVLAQGDPGQCIWSKPINLSQSPDMDTTFGQIIGDPFGRVHAFWGESPVKDKQPERSYVAYRVWDGKSWSSSVDILASPSGKSATFVYDVDIYVPVNRIYLLWRNEAGLFVSSAPLDNATDPHEWRSALVTSGSAMTAWPHMALDKDGGLHVLLVDSNRTVQLTTSTDDGYTWDVQTTIWNVPGQEDVIDRQDLIIGKDGTYHAVWQINLGEGQQYAAYGIYYTQSKDEGVTWTTPILWDSIPLGYADPALFEDSRGTLHLFWNGAAGTLDGRYYSWSEDGGVTWSPVEPLSGGYYTGGRSGAPRMIEDSAGVVHVVHASQMASAGSASRVVTSYLTNHTWSPPMIVTDQRVGDAPALTITSGNRLHVLLWTQVSPAELLYTTCQLQSPELTPILESTRTPDVIVTAVSSALNTPSPKALANSANQSLSVSPELLTPSSQRTNSRSFPLVLGGGAATLVVLSAFIMVAARRTTRK